ncbi:MAG: glutamate-1-semialdehyde-2,1-aminomutase [Gammaproteobacteria bacterium]|nr:glutamate-1-semialdehyde-2,1-aminomutase [Gammaproteobacteria bacterium]MYD79334.1 glutamate-1-semialdehyde-2,1-aminomutase [Gammaproteobacteria bacterium]
MDQDLSQQLFKRAQDVIPGGVNSPVRAFKNVGGTPIFFLSGIGPYLADVDGNHYIDYVASWGPMLRGYSCEPVVHALRDQSIRATSFGAPTLQEIEMAELVVDRVASIEKVRMVNSGTEATMSAIRLARGFTGRDRIVKFEGCFHGHGDSLLVKAGSGVMTLGLPDSPGVPADLAKHTLTLPFNDCQAIEETFASMGDDIACVIVEPIAGNMGVVPPIDGFLESLRKVTQKHGSLLIFDEVMTGFRVAPGGAQELYGVTPDITTLGKVIGGGLPVGAFGGTAEIMDQLAPMGPIYQSGTLSGNPLAMSAGLALLKTLDDEFYSNLEECTTTLVEGLLREAQATGIDLQINSVCGMFSLFFTTQQDVLSYEHVMQCDAERYRKFFREMLNNGVYFAPSPYESAFVGGSHTSMEISRTIEHASRALQSLV